MYLTMNSHEFAALARMNEPRDVRSVQLSRRDSLDNLMTDGTGALVVSVVPVNGETFRIAIGETGAMVPWGDKPEPRTRMLLALHSQGPLPATSLRHSDDRARHGGDPLGSLIVDGLVCQRRSVHGLGVVYALTAAGQSQARRLSS